jgi:predicted PurR-regulated permease PerM
MANQPKNKTEIMHFVGQNRWLIIAIAFIFIAYLLLPILTPFLIAAILAYICDPMADKLCLIGFGKYKLSRTFATIIVLIGLVFIIIALLLVLVPLLQKQSSLIMEKLPSLVDAFHNRFEPWLSSKFGVDFAIDGAHIKELIAKNWKNTGDIVSNILKTASSQGLAFIGMAANLLLLPVVLFYLLRDWDELIAKIGELIPRKWIAVTTSIAKEVDQVVAEFLRGQLSVMLSLCVFYSIGLWIAGLEMALSIGLIAGLLSFVPYLGFAIAFIMAVLLALLQFSSLTEVVPVLLVFGIGQVVESYILTPYLVGDRIGLHPVIVILALLAGGQLFGFTGVLLALPISAAIAVGLKHTKASYLNSEAYLK